MRNPDINPKLRSFLKGATFGLIAVAVFISFTGCSNSGNNNSGYNPYGWWSNGLNPNGGGINGGLRTAGVEQNGYAMVVLNIATNMGMGQAAVYGQLKINVGGIPCGIGYIPGGIYTLGSPQSPGVVSFDPGTGIINGLQIMAVNGPVPLQVTIPFGQIIQSNMCGFGSALTGELNIDMGGGCGITSGFVSPYQGYNTTMCRM